MEGPWSCSEEVRVPSPARVAEGQIVGRRRARERARGACAGAVRGGAQEVGKETPASRVYIIIGDVRARDLNRQ